MFTGIITHQGTITALEQTGDWVAIITPNLPFDALAIGASVACSGICLTVVEKAEDGRHFTVQLSRETIQRTNAKDWEVGTVLNLERALKVGDELGGHWVTGHVDGLALIDAIDAVSDSHRLTLSVPVELARFIAQKGSVTLDGVSLTVNQVDGLRFTVNLIPHSWAVTTLSQRQVGDALNLEVDLMARYVARLAEQKGSE